jgi:multidrug transporter EmrE-like cation transporter
VFDDPVGVARITGLVLIVVGVVVLNLDGATH